MLMPFNAFPQCLILCSVNKDRAQLKNSGSISQKKVDYGPMCKVKAFSPSILVEACSQIVILVYLYGWSLHINITLNRIKFTNRLKPCHVCIVQKPWLRFATKLGVILLITSKSNDLAKRSELYILKYYFMALKQTSQQRQRYLLRLCQP